MRGDVMAARVSSLWLSGAAVKAANMVGVNPQSPDGRQTTLRTKTKQPHWPEECCARRTGNRRRVLLLLESENRELLDQARFAYAGDDGAPASLYPGLSHCVPLGLD